MTDRIHSLTVVFKEDVRSDDCEAWVDAIKMMHNVLSVTPHVTDVGDHMAQERARRELGDKLLGVLYPEMVK